LVPPIIISAGTNNPLAKKMETAGGQWGAGVSKEGFVDRLESLYKEDKQLIS
jgi:hypothetical protein